MEIKKNLKVIIVSVCLAVSLGFCIYNVAQFFILPSENEANIMLEKAKDDLETSRKLENYDELTKTLNREGFEDFFGYFLKEEKKAFGEHYVGLYLLNFSSATKGLKAINDEYGHLVGDNLPVAFAEHLKGVFDDDRFVFARRSGSAFIVLDTNYHGRDDITARVQKLKEVWHDTPYKIDENHFINGLALHVFCFPFEVKTEERSVEELIEFVCGAANDMKDLASFTFSFDGDKTPIMGD